MKRILLFTLVPALLTAALAIPPVARADDTAVQVQRNASSTTLTGSKVGPTSGPQPPNAVQQPRGTLHAGPDGNWILRPLNGLSYAQRARDRYECDIAAVDQTGYDPTQDEGGVAPAAVPDRRADYLRAEAACFKARGYVMR